MFYVYTCLNLEYRYGYETKSIKKERIMME